MSRWIPLLWLPACVGTSASPPLVEPVCDRTWEGFAEPLITTWCAPCHSSTVPEADRRDAPLGMDFDSWSAVLANADRIAAAVDSGAMPPAGGLTEAERVDLVEWIACGAPGSLQPADPCSERIEHVGDAGPAGEPCLAGANTVTGDLVIDADPGSALDCVCEVDGNLVVSRDATAVSLPRLERVGGSVHANASGLGVLELPVLASAASFSLDAVPLSVLDLDALTTVDGSLVFVDGTLPETFGPARLRTVGASVVLQRVDGIVTLDLPRLETVGTDLVVDGLPRLTQIVHTSDLQTIGGSLRVVGNPALETTTDFAYLASVGGDLEVGGGLQAWMNGFWSLETVGGDLILRDEPVMTRIVAFPKLATVGGDLELTRLGVNAIEGFESLVSAGGVIVADDPGLDGIGFPVLGDVSGSVIVSRNDSLEWLDLDLLVSIGADLQIEDDPTLATLDGLGGLERVDGDLLIRGNLALPQSDVDFLLGRVVVGGQTTVSGNGP